MEKFFLLYGEELQVVIFVASFLLFLAFERIFPRRGQVSGTRERLKSNLMLSIIALLSLPLVPVTFYVASLWAQHHSLGFLNLVTLPLGIAILLTIFLRGLVSYFTHFLNHRLPWLWRLHRMHHMDTEVDVSTTIRFHPVEMVVSTVIGLPLVVLFGLSPWVLLVYELLDAVVTVFSHSNTRLPQRLNKWLRYIIATPDIHRVHHSSRSSETNSNYSPVFPVIDILFGTFRTMTEDKQEDMELGLKEVRDGRARDVIWLLKSPFLEI